MMILTDFFNLNPASNFQNSINSKLAGARFNIPAGVFPDPGSGIDEPESSGV